MASQMEMKQIMLTRECLEKQLQEYELLKSMYSNPGEFQSDNPYLVDDIQEFLVGNRMTIQEKLDYRIKLQLNEKVKMELSVVLSQFYPSHEQPMLIIRTDTLSKQQEKAIKVAIEDFIENEVDKSEPYMFHVISWLQDNIDVIVKAPPSETGKAKAGVAGVELKRIWLWSHHIYSKIKRQDIMKLSKDYDLRGFMWPGKPGVLCFEGAAEGVEEVVKIIKGWQWQKLKIVRVETSAAAESTESFSKFDKFNEILTTENEGEAAKMDSGEFFKYLESHNAAYMRKELFGFD